jgi:hypothetical protein
MHQLIEAGGGIYRDGIVIVHVCDSGASLIFVLRNLKSEYINQPAKIWLVPLFD